MFVDRVTIRTQAGRGGDGLVSWRREKFIARGGPDGGDGGNGGDVVLIADHNLDTLSAFRHQPLIKAADGGNGRRRRAHGKSGADQLVKVPLGTVVTEGGRVLADLHQEGQSVIVAKGGRGGYGNAHFTSSVRQAPELAEVGEPGEAKELQFELKLIADVGLVGLPNAGKSTLLSVISSAKPEIADYPFTTLVPNLGVVDVDGASLLLADIPGLIAGASRGKGLGDEFLRHIERTSVILHLIDSTHEDVVGDFRVIKQELKDYKASGLGPNRKVNLGRRPQIVVLTKTDALTNAQIRDKKLQLEKASKSSVFPISSVAKQGLLSLIRATAKLVKGTPTPSPRTKAVPRLTLADNPDAWWVEKKYGKFIIRGQKIEGFGRRTNVEAQAGLNRLLDIMKRQGISRELVRLGIKNGDTISIGGKDFKW